MSSVTTPCRKSESTGLLLFWWLIICAIIGQLEYKTDIISDFQIFILLLLCLPENKSRPKRRLQRNGGFADIILKYSSH